VTPLFETPSVRRDVADARMALLAASGWPRPGGSAPWNATLPFSPKRFQRSMRIRFPRPGQGPHPGPASECPGPPAVSGC
jgi:hypothetical protein